MRIILVEPYGITLFLEASTIIIRRSSTYFRYKIYTFVSVLLPFGLFILIFGRMYIFKWIITHCEITLIRVKTSTNVLCDFTGRMPLITNIFRIALLEDVGNVAKRDIKLFQDSNQHQTINNNQAEALLVYQVFIFSLKV